MRVTLKLRVRRLERDDLALRVSWFNHPEVYRYMTLDVPMSLAATERWFQSASVDEKRRDFAFDLWSEQEIRPVAMGGLIDINWHHSRAELYMLVSPQHFGRKIGRQVLRWMCNYGFSALGLQRIYLTTVEDNRRAQKLYRSHGFQEEGRLRKHLYHLGKYKDRIIFGLLRDEWEQATWAAVSRSVELEIDFEESIS